MKPRVLLHAFSTFSLGGAQARFVQLANSYGPAYRHLVVAMDGDFSAGQRLDANVIWEPLEVENRRGTGLANRRAFRAHLRAWRPDSVFTYNFGAIEWAAANLPRLAPHVHVEDGFGPQEAQQQLPRRVWTRRLLLGLGGAALVVPSQTLAALAPDWWMPLRRWRYIPNGVAVPADARPRPELAASAAVTLACVGGLRPEKNVGRLIRACAQLQQHHDLRLLLVGDGPERAALQTLARDSGLAERVAFMGHVAQPQACLAKADLFVLSSDTEQLPIALLEAMALGLPAVATRVGDVPQVVPEVAHAGLSTPDDDAFTAALDLALRHRNDWPVWAEAGLSRVRQRYAQANMLEAWRLVFDGHLRTLPHRAAGRA
jgi:glycosyltransferase involved in cell wall biosynthesis